MAIIFSALTIMVLLFITVPKTEFVKPLSTVLYDCNGELLGAQIADDGQWRFPVADSVPEKFKKCILYFEDEYFYYHPGINPVSYYKAFVENIRAGKTVRGGSTITLQVARLAGNRKERTVRAKLVESFIALKLEVFNTKKAILEMYVSNAPFGGNVVGLEAAAWRYCGRPSHMLSWGESAALAVLPNAPSLVYPGRNQQVYLVKRNRLLEKLMDHKVIDSVTCRLAKEEPLPGEPLPLPSLSPHLLSRAVKDGFKGSILITTIDRDIQQQALSILDRHHRMLAANEINNAAIIILEVETGNVLAYIGNTNDNTEHSAGYVDIITSVRSPGSILKPFLYAAAIQEGLLMPDALLADIPTQVAGYSPVNFDKKYDGAVRAGNALARSLNIPAVRLLQEYRVEKFHHKLGELGFTTINKPPGHYGLSLILGGAEVSLWELSGAYAGMARMLDHYATYSSRYDPDDYHYPVYLATENHTRRALSKTGILGAAAVWHTFGALTLMDRPVEGSGNERFSSSQRIAWKTGTSFGNRDAWAVGITPEYVVAVWAGNADGEGRPGLTGAGIAAPLMFDIMNILPPTGWFEQPYDDMTEIAVCRESGYKASPVCANTDTVMVSEACLKSVPCPYHTIVHLDSTRSYRVTADCYPVSDMVTESWFTLPVVMEWFYKSGNPWYRELPPFLPACGSGEDEGMDLVYPEASATKLFIPRALDGTPQKVVFEAAHRRNNAVIFWNLDQSYLSSTTTIHQVEISAPPGPHTLTLIDDLGEKLIYNFEVVSR